MSMQIFESVYFVFGSNSKQLNNAQGKRIFEKDVFVSGIFVLQTRGLFSSEQFSKLYNIVAAQDFASCYNFLKQIPLVVAVIPAKLIFEGAKIFQRFVPQTFAKRTTQAII